jgi:hypothetical protein
MFGLSLMMMMMVVDVGVVELVHPLDVEYVVID